MSPENFVYWLQGWMEIQNPTAINSTQLGEIKNHLALVSLSFGSLAPLEFITTTQSITGVCGFTLNPMLEDEEWSDTFSPVFDCSRKLC